MKNSKFSFLIILVIMLSACNDNSNNNPISNTEKGYEVILNNNAKAYCDCLKIHEDYVKSNDNFEDPDKKMMKRALMKRAQICIQKSDKEYQELQNLATELSQVDRKLYNNNFRKKFKKMCPDEANTIISLWGNVGPLPEN